jgi:alginate O-acetyltransferase complex protein AlgI
MGLTFTSLEFIFFLGVCLGLLHASGRLSVRTWLLIIFSYLFYLTFGVGGVLVVTFMAVVDFIVGLRLGNTISEVTRKRWLWAGLAANLGPLVFLKYSGFFVEIVAAFLHPLGVRVSLPGSPVFSIIGLSYFTFAGMSYVLDVYRETMEPARSLSEFVCYLMYFPKLVAGPIVRAADFLPQFSRGFQITAQDFEIGCGYLLVRIFSCHTVP